MEIKDKILQTAFDLFVRFGIKSISMDDIAGKIGASKKTIYQWFENKDELVEEALKQFINQIEEESAEKPLHCLDALFQKILRINNRLADIHISFFNDLKKYHWPVYQVLEKYQNNQFRQFFISNLQQGKSEGYYRPDVDVDIISRFCILQFSIIYNGETFQAGQYDLKLVRRQIFKLFLMGIVTAKGNEFLASK